MGPFWSKCRVAEYGNKSRGAELTRWRWVLEPRISRFFSALSSATQRRSQEGRALFSKTCNFLRLLLIREAYIDSGGAPRCRIHVFVGPLVLPMQEFKLVARTFFERSLVGSPTLALSARRPQR